ncbi:aKG-HExxH-type peptide beta-hydroxylase [Lysinibacillus xylanilyticus]|uniref:HEXXH motif domain-containing protein n=1 Tax=Lysinibacillus xylanilyticus TaxID=582475 RepID=A0A2M9Q5S9_9BACI|nr:HEXXH motif-containing putative peptide modification protein [Lysinibacillus xylanilyticus]PJO43415.1 hypothetical protein CWD94_12765 [Lysinibacillus xylanilyticus]
MINEQLKSISTIEINSKQEKIEYGKFINALKKQYAKVLEQSGCSVNEDLEYCPRISWIALKGWKSEYDNKSEHWWITNFLHEHALDNENEFNKNISLKYIETEEEEKVNINRANELLKIVWPEAYEQINRLVTNIYMVYDESNSNFYSTTAPYWFGGVFIKKDQEWNAINYLDTLLHESGHLSLMIKQSYVRMLNNLNDKAKSPLREDPRWLNGILHAAFALWRICEGLKRILEQPTLINSLEKKTALNLLKRYFMDLGEAIETLNNNGDFTEYGKVFFSQIIESYSKMKEEIKWLI